MATPPFLPGQGGPQSSLPQASPQSEIMKLLLPFLMKQQQQKQAMPPSLPGAQSQLPQQASPQQAPASMQGLNLGGDSTGGLSLPDLTTKTDPRAQTGSLPTPIAQPGPRGYQAPVGAAEMINKLDPKSALHYQAFQGVSQAISSFAQKRDAEKKSEAANAAQALMQALDAKDYVSATSILHDNEQLFNKVYKGWLQKSQDAQKQQDADSKAKQKTKKPDPDVSGFEKGMQDYMSGKSQQAPQAPTSLQGKSGQSYMIPRANPAQQLQGQQESSALQQLTKLGADPKTLGEFAKLQADIEKSNNEVSVSRMGVQKAAVEAQAAASKSESEQAEAKTKLNQANTEYQGKLVDLDIKRQALANIKAQTLNIKARGALTGQLSQGYRTKLAAIDQAGQILDSIDASKGKYTDTDMASLAQQLQTAGMGAPASNIKKYVTNKSVLQKMGFNAPDLGEIRTNLDSYKQTLNEGLSKIQSAQIGPSSNSGDVDIEVSPEDLK